MMFVEIAIKLAAQRGFKLYRMPINPNWLCFDKPNGTPIGRCMITDNQISRHNFEHILSD